MTDADGHDRARDVRHEREVMAFVNGETDVHPFGDVTAAPSQERARCQRCGNVVRLVTESHIVGGVDEDEEGEECDGSDSDEWEATDALPPQQAANEGGDRCAEMRRRGDAISALCWALRQGADPVETAQKIGGHAANIAVHYGLPAPSVASDAVRRNVLVPAAPPPTSELRACFGICDHVDCLP